ncbi:MAG: ATP-binding cassette domain-containing protein [Gemmatimonadota bacterium]|nr:ATP-binding cassette domain-containing protein [Gemmatimonadota bacterium]
MRRILLQQVTKTFDGVTAVDGLDLDIGAGEVFGLLGPNGAGKTTTIRTILGIYGPDSGTIDYGNGGTGLSRDCIGYLPEERGLYPKMRVMDLLVFLGEIKSLSRSEAAGRAGEWLERMGLSEWSNRRVDQLSKGMQQKLQFIATIIHDPDLLILDEPFSGLDPINVAVLKEIMQTLTSEGKILIFSTHQMEDAEALCDRICLINRGRKVLEGTVTELKSKYTRNRLRIAFNGSDDFLKDTNLVRHAENQGNHVEVELQTGADPGELLRQALSAAQVHRFEVSEPSLRDIFLMAVGGEDSGDDRNE